MAYSISKNFVVWYSKVSAAKFGGKNTRILSVSPGTFDTEMGRLVAQAVSKWPLPINVRVASMPKHYTTGIELTDIRLRRL